MFLLKWIKNLFNPEKEVTVEPFSDLNKETTSEVVVKPTPTKPKRKRTKKSTGGKKNG